MPKGDWKGDDSTLRFKGGNTRVSEQAHPFIVLLNLRFPTFIIEQSTFTVGTVYCEEMSAIGADGEYYRV